MMRLSFTDMKDRNRVFLFPTNKPIRRFLDVPFEQTDGYRYGIPLCLRVNSYLYQLNGVNLSDEDMSTFRRSVFRELIHNQGETWRSCILDIDATGMEASRTGSIVRRVYAEFINRGRTWDSPLDQFSIHPIIDLHIGNFYISFTNLAFFMLLTFVFVLVVFFFVTKKGGGKSVPNAWQSLVELIYDFVLNLVNEQIGGNVKQKFFPCISVTFTFSLFRNPQGMIPFSFTVTSHFLITLALSFSIFIGITIVGFQRHGLHFLSFLLPAGVPLPLAPFLVLLELISYCFRALSLGIRLFANMMAGHSLVKILSGFAWTMLFLHNIFYFIGDLGPLFIVLALTGLELGVAISQAHVSTISICIYLNDAINLH